MISTKNDVTEKQLQIEKEYNDIVDLYEALKLSEDEANEKLEELVNNAISGRDMKSYIFRRDPKGHTRTHIEFAIWLRKKCREEKDEVNYFCDWFKRGGHTTRYESLGSDGEGLVLLFNVSSRSKSPIEPDYKIWVDEDGPWPVEIKIADGRKICFKVYDLNHYKEKGACIFMRFNKSHYIFKKKAIKYLLDNTPPPYREEWGKEVIIINENGINADFSLEELSKDTTLVRKI